MNLAHIGIAVKSLDVSAAVFEKIFNTKASEKEFVEEQKLIVRTTEGKLTNVYPTPKAKAMLPELKGCLQEFHQAYTSLLGREESTRLVGHINKLADKLP